MMFNLLTPDGQQIPRNPLPFPLIRENERDDAQRLSLTALTLPELKGSDSDAVQPSPPYDPQFEAIQLYIKQNGIVFKEAFHHASRVSEILQDFKLLPTKTARDELIIHTSHILRLLNNLPPDILPRSANERINMFSDGLKKISEGLDMLSDGLRFLHSLQPEPVT